MAEHSKSQYAAREASARPLNEQPQQPFHCGACLVQKRLRKMVIEMVLATDMKQHCLILSRFQSKLQVGQQDLSSLSCVAQVKVSPPGLSWGSCLRPSCGGTRSCTLALCRLCRDSSCRVPLKQLYLM